MRQVRHPIRLIPTVLGGLLASAGLIAANQLAHAAGRTDLDLPRVLGLTFRQPGQAGIKPAGLAWYLVSGGCLVPLLYWLGLRGMGQSGPLPGLLLGTVHYLAASALLALTDPPRPKRSFGEGRPLGAFLRHYGAFERWSNLLAHLGYGVVVGTAAGRGKG